MDKPDLSRFPKTPGVYFFKGATGHILYVGKAIRLRNRLASYFRAENTLTPKTRLMVASAATIDYLQTETEKEALLLEASLIKKHRPRYNIVLRDDKEYLLFRINERHPFPRLEIVRKSSLRKDGRRMVQGKIFGPYSSAAAARETWKLIHRYFPLRRCRDNAFKNRTSPCIYYHMGQCLGPCVLPVSQEEYKSVLRKVEMLLSGRSLELIEKVDEEMMAASENLDFEKAAALRDQSKAIQQTLERQSVVLPRKTDIDLIGVTQVPEGLALGIVFVRGGLLLDGRNFFWPGLSVEETPELLFSFITQYYLQGKAEPPRKIVVPWMQQGIMPQEGEEIAQKDEIETLEAALADAGGHPVHISVPKNADEDRLLLMASANAREAAKATSSRSMGEMLAAVFKVGHPVRRIEVVDISHTSGRQTKAGMVVFEDERPVKNDYRQYSLDDNLVEAGAEAGDDYAALAIWAKRRAGAGAPWPDLILVDGGRGQLAAVHRVFSEEGLTDSFLLASIAKARDEEGHADRRAGNVSDRIFLPLRSNPLPLKPGSAELLYLQRVRDTAHDFVIGRHRRARSAAALSGELTRLPGVGPKMARQLYEHFGSLSAMADAGVEGLLQVPGIGKAKATMLAERISLLVKEVKGNKDKG